MLAAQTTQSSLSLILHVLFASVLDVRDIVIALSPSRATPHMYILALKYDLGLPTKFITSDRTSGCHLMCSFLGEQTHKVREFRTWMH